MKQLKTTEKQSRFKVKEGLIMKYIKYLTLVVLIFQLAFALSYKDLFPYLVELKGWKGEKPTGSKISATFGEMITAERSYVKDSKRIHISIIKGGMAVSMFAPFSMITEIDTPEEYVKVFKIGSFKAGLSHRKKENSGQIIVLLTGDSVFSMEYTDMEYKEALKLLKEFPLKDIARKTSGL